MKTNAALVEAQGNVRSRL